MGGNWVVQSLVAMLIISPIWVAIGFFDKNFHVKPDVFLIWYFLGVVVTTLFLGESPAKSFVLPLKVFCLLLFIGLVGGVANMLLFWAVASAPNPGLPVAIGNGASVGSFLLVILFSRLAPNYFNTAKFDGVSFLGIILTVIGITIIALSGNKEVQNGQGV